MNTKTADELLSQILAELNPTVQLNHVGPMDDRTMNLAQWVAYLNSLTGKTRVHFTSKSVTKKELVDTLSEFPIPLIVFSDGGPKLVKIEGKKPVLWVHDGFSGWQHAGNSLLDSLQDQDDNGGFLGPGNDKALVIFPLKMTDDTAEENPTPFKRFVNLLRDERKNIWHIYIYAILAGLLGLTLPLGVQSVVSLISGGLFLRPVVLLTVFVVVGVFLTGVMQIMQMTIVENVQQRIFTRTAVDFAFRIPRIKMEHLLKVYTPELVNRFFDVLTIQKGLTKILVDFITALLQIVFGLLLLSLYHPVFVFFGLLLMLILFLLFYFTWRKGLQTSLQESKYKYRIVHWLEELGRNLITFKVASSSPLPMEKLDENLRGYIGRRKAHFKVLISQFRGFVVFKTGIVGTLLVLGSYLVIDRQISVGQFVAAELVIILVISAIEKLILHLDNIYDVLTAVEKLGNLTDLPLEEENAPLDVFDARQRGFDIRAKNLTYYYPDSKVPAIKNINLSVASCESIAIIGGEGSGKTTLMYVLCGILESYKGQLYFDDKSLRDLNTRLLRNRIGDSLSHEHIFEGTFYENLTLKRSGITSDDLERVLDITELKEFVAELPKGLQTPLVASGKGVSSAITKKIVLARSLLAQPRLVVFDDFFFNLESAFKKRLFKRLLYEKEMACTFIISSHDPLVLEAADNIYVLDRGSVAISGKYEEIKNEKLVQCLIN